VPPRQPLLASALQYRGGARGGPAGRHPSSMTVKMRTPSTPGFAAALASAVVSHACAARTSDTWRVVTARRYREAVARVRLAEQGLETYLPRLRRWPRSPVGSDVGPLFPGYVFVRLT
jgi:hypothetical protein